MQNTAAVFFHLRIWAPRMVEKTAQEYSLYTIALDRQATVRELEAIDLY
jgi:hypothetical protein